MKPSHDWPTWKIEECCDILDSKRVPINSEERERRIGDIPYYGANGQQGYIDDFIFDEPLILVAEDGGRFDEFSTRPIAYRIAGKSWVNNHAHVLRARYGFSQDAIFYTLEHKDIQPFIVGGTRTKLNQSVLRSITIQLPERESEQTKIAEILSTVDQAIDQTEALIAKKQRIKTGLMQDLLTRGIDENGNLRSEETHEFKGSPLGRIPVEWDVRNINSMSDFVTSGARGWAQYYGDEGAVFLRIGNLTRDHINMRFDDTVFVRPPGSAEGLRTLVAPGDVLISVTADLGIIGVIPEGFGEGYVNQHIALVRISDPEVDQRFVGWFLQSRAGQAQFERHNESGAKAGLNLPTIRSLLVASPPLDEQRHIAKVLDANTERIAGFQAELDKQSHLKTALMQDLLTGKVSVAPLLTDAEGSTGSD